MTVLRALIRGYPATRAYLLAWLLILTTTLPIQ